MKEYVLRIVAMNERAEGLLNEAWKNTDEKMTKVCLKIGLKKDDFILQYRERDL